MIRVLIRNVRTKLMAESKQKFRSPHYPAIALEKAIERVSQLRKVANGYPVPLMVAAKAWGFSEKSSATTTVAAALNQYGLINDEGARETRRISVSLLGEKIILDPRPDSLDRMEAIREAALSPTIFTELWEKFQSSEVDSHTLLYELTLGRKQTGQAPFSSSAALDVVKVYRQSLEFAGIKSAAQVEESQSRKSVDVDGYQDQMVSGSDSKQATDVEIPEQPDKSDAQTAYTSPANHFEEKKALDEGNAILIWPRELSSDSVEDIEYWLTGVLRQIKRRAEKTS